MTDDNCIGSEARAARQDRPGRTGRLWFIASLDRPVNGQTIANRLMLSLVETRVTPICLGLGATPREKLSSALRLTGAALRASPRDRVYISLPGQRGGWLLLAALLSFRLIGARLFLHHHSYRALQAGPTRLGHALTRLAGPRAVHILLSDAMAAAFGARYLAPDAARPLIVSNAALLPAPPPAIRNIGPITVGFLGAWTPAKGIDHVLDLAERLLRSDPQLHIAIAGAPPAGAGIISSDIGAMAARWPDRVTVSGWLEGAEKAAFLGRLDCLLLPSRLPDEAEPLSMLEAYRAGADVMATPRGAIPERIRSPDCLLILNLDADQARIARVIGDRRSDREAATKACRDHALRMRRASEPALARLLAGLTAEMNLAAGTRPPHAARRATP